MPSHLARKYYISGEVQGVGYRAFAQQAARGLGIRGWARNLDDGRVEVLAIGAASKLEDFEGELRVGPRYGNVRRVEVEEAAEVGVEGFHIR
jgi:acylphosphatase